MGIRKVPALLALGELKPAAPNSPNPEGGGNWKGAAPDPNARGNRLPPKAVDSLGLAPNVRAPKDAVAAATDEAAAPRADPNPGTVAVGGANALATDSRPGL